MNKLTPSIVLFCLLCLSHLSASPGALADYYKYTDSNGVVSITNKLESVPAKYRSTMKVVRETPPKDAGAVRLAEPQPEPAGAAAPEQESAQAPDQEPEGKFAQLSARFPWFKPLVYLAVIVVLFVVVLKVTSLLPSPLLAKAICVAFFLGVSVFLYKAYVAHLVEGTAKIKDNATNMMKKSMVREQQQVDPTAEAAK